MKKIYLFFLSICSLGLGCKEFIEPSLEDRKVILLAPWDGTETKDYTQTFWWDNVEDALKYRLQVVSPGFGSTTKLVVDTLVKGNKFKYTLDPGNYQWRVRAENGSSQSAYTVGGLTVYPTSITEQQVQLSAPANNALTSQSPVLFKWLKLFSADKYQIQIDADNTNFASGTTLFLDKTTTSLEYAVSFTKDQVYQWRVKAYNGTLESKWSGVQTISYDATPPPAVVLTAPANNAASPKPVTLKWNASAGAKKYTLYVYKGDVSIPYNSTFPLSQTALSYTFNLGNSGEKILWEVKAVDEAGNISPAGELRSFTIQ